jgi:hypothetical protein
MMTNPAVVALPGGLWLDGVRHRDVLLHPLTGADEAFLVEAGESLPRAKKVTALLARCMQQLAPLAPVSMDVARSLTTGDREALLLHLRRLTLGDRLQCVLTCPHPDCGEKMDLELTVSDLLQPPYPHAREWYETTVTENGSTYRVRFRLPTGADQEEAAALARDDPQAAAVLILHRCVESVSDGGSPTGDRPPALVDHLSATMSMLDPQAELSFDLACPACEHAFSAALDVAAYFFQELAGRSRYVYWEVHTLALHYHWSEKDILNMTARKRQIYLDLLAEERGR